MKYTICPPGAAQGSEPEPQFANRPRRNGELISQRVYLSPCDLVQSPEMEHAEYVRDHVEAV